MVLYKGVGQSAGRKRNDEERINRTDSDVPDDEQRGIQRRKSRKMGGKDRKCVERREGGIGRTVKHKSVYKNG